jgi:hypothetical protein
VARIRITRFPEYTLHIAVRAGFWLASVVWALLADNPIPLMVLVASGGAAITAGVLWHIGAGAAWRRAAVGGGDIIIGVALAVGSGAWQTPLAIAALGGIVAPALAGGWRGGLLAGGFTVISAIIALSLAGASPVAHIVGTTDGIGHVFALLFAPPLVGAALAWCAETSRPDGIALPKPAATAAPPRARRQWASGGGALPAMRQGEAEPPQAAVVAPPRVAAQHIEALRTVLFAPMPADIGGLPREVQLLAERFSRTTQIVADVTVLGRPRPIRPAHAALLGRVAREALLNIRAHAAATGVTLALHYDAASVAMVIQDNGVGLIDGQHDRPGLHTLRALRYRIAEFGGRLEVLDHYGSGVTVRATVPLE